MEQRSERPTPVALTETKVPEFRLFTLSRNPYNLVSIRMSHGKRDTQRHH